MTTENKTTAATAQASSTEATAKRFPAKVLSIFGDLKTKTNGNLYKRMIIEITAPSGNKITQFADRNIHRTDPTGKPLEVTDTETGEVTFIENAMPIVGQKVQAVMLLGKDNVTGEDRPFFAISLSAEITDMATTLSELA